MRKMNYQQKYVLGFITACVLILTGSTIIDFYAIALPAINRYLVITVSLILVVAGVILLAESIFNRVRAEIMDPNSEINQQSGALVSSVRDSLEFYTKDLKSHDYKVLTTIDGQSFARVPADAFQLAEELKGKDIIVGDVVTIPAENPLTHSDSRFIIAVGAKGSIVKYHLHKEIDQRMFIIYGELEQKLRRGKNEETVLLKENDSILIPAGVEHETVHTEDCCYFIIYQPKSNE